MFKLKNVTYEAVPQSAIDAWQNNNKGKILFDMAFANSNAGTERQMYVPLPGFKIDSGVYMLSKTDEVYTVSDFQPEFYLPIYKLDKTDFKRLFNDNCSIVVEEDRNNIFELCAFECDEWTVIGTIYENVRSLELAYDDKTNTFYAEALTYNPQFIITNDLIEEYRKYAKNQESDLPF